MAQKLLEALKNKGLFKCNTYAQNEIIKDFHQTSYKKVYLVKSGFVKISCPNEFGEKIISIILTKGQFFGFTQLLSDTNMNYCYESILDNTELHEFDISHVKAMTKNNLIFKQELLLNIGQEYHILENRIMILQHRFIKERLCKTMSEFKKNLQFSPVESTLSMYDDIPLNQDELASYIRGSRIITNKVFNQLRNNFFRDCIHNR